MSEPQANLNERAEEMDMDFEERLQDRLDGEAGGCMNMAEALAEMRRDGDS